MGDPSQSVDNDLEFFRLTMQQIEHYMKAKNKESIYLSFFLVDKAREALPEDDLFPELSKQMATFGEST